MITDSLSRFLAAQDVLSALTCLDQKATLAAAHADFNPELDTLLEASLQIGGADDLALLRTLRAEVRKRLPEGELSLLVMAEQAVVACAFRDCLDEDLQLKLWMPWALFSVLSPSENPNTPQRAPHFIDDEEIFAPEYKEGEEIFERDEDETDYDFDDDWQEFSDGYLD